MIGFHLTFLVRRHFHRKKLLRLISNEKKKIRNLIFSIRSIRKTDLLFLENDYFLRIALKVTNPFVPYQNIDQPFHYKLVYAFYQDHVQRPESN